VTVVPARHTARMTPPKLPRVDEDDTATVAGRLREQAAAAYAEHNVLWAQAEALQVRAGEQMTLGDTLTEAANRLTAPVTEVFVDFSLIGHATEFTVRVHRAQRSQLREGDHVLVFDDDVPTMPAVVVQVRDDEPDVTFRLLTGK